MKHISLEQINNFKNMYDKNPTNKIIENAITHNGIQSVCLNEDVVKKAKNVFNIEIPTYRIYDQTGSARCWCYAGINMIKNDISNNLNINPKELDLSINYIIFFDKLEKSNNTYENIISLDNVNYDFLNKENILTNCVDEGGWFEWFVAIVNKYGIVPSIEMPETINSKDSTILTMIFTEKVKKDVIKLIEMKQKNISVDNIRKEKTKMLQENYVILCKVLGEPPTQFNFEYKDKENNYIRIDNLTPIEFKNRFLNINLDDFVAVCHVPMYNKPLNNRYRKKYLQNVIDKSYVNFINVPIEDLKELAIKQLRDGTPVWFASEVKKMRDKERGILDSNLYDYKSVLGIEPLTKEESLNLSDIVLQHAMVFTGVNIKDNKPERWKVEDSYGDKVHKNGFYIMNDNFFSDFVMEVIVHKKYLNKNQLELLEKDPIWFDVNDPL
ncbi:MAG: hypothetical protein J6J36_00135 [Clostridia bacterium]|nr:hypothetical protein [Clostridia bacterium]